MSRGRLDGVAGIEQYGAALFHVGVDAVERVLRRLGRARYHRPVDQREERQFVMRRIDADGIAGLERGALGEEQRQSRHARLDDGIDVGIAGDDISQPRLRDRLDREIILFVGMGRRRRHQRGRDQRESQRRRYRAPPQQRRETGAEQGDDDRIDQEQRQRRRQQHAAQVARLGIGVAARRARNGETSSGAMRSAAASVLTASGPSAGP